VELAAALAAACGLILSPHSYVYDCAVLLPLAAICLRRMNSAMLIPSVLTLSPIPVLLTASSMPWIGQAMAVGFVFAALFWAHQEDESASVETRIHQSATV
jgi:hypothetical protein